MDEVVSFPERPIQTAHYSEMILDGGGEVWLSKTRAIGGTAYRLSGEDVETDEVTEDSISGDSMHPTHVLDEIKNSAPALIRDGVEPPSASAFILSEVILDAIINHNLAVPRITASAEGGICFVFTRESLKLYLEVYNNGEIGYIIEDFRAREVIENRDIELTDAIAIITKFLIGE